MMRLPLASIGVWIALLALMGASVATTVLLTTPVAYALNFALAVAMAALVLIDFMGLREADGLTRVFALAAFGWLIFLLVLTLADYLTRG